MPNGPVFLDWQVHDATLRFASSPPDLRFARARRLVQAKFERGDYEMLQALDDATRDGLARAMCDAVATARSTQEPAGAAVPPRICP